MYNKVFKLHEMLYKALASQKRVEIIHLLRDQELSVSEMQDMLGLPQANLSQHLSVLREHGVVETRRNGTAIYYKLSHPNIVKASDLFREMLLDQQKDDVILSEELKWRMKDLVPVVIDPVCGMRLSPKTAAVAVNLNKEAYYFCASGCKEKFIKDRKKYINKRRKN